MNETKPEWDDDLGAALINAVVLIGITRLNGDEATQEQFFGTIEKADPQGILLMLGGLRAGEQYRLPPDPRAFTQADPGVYRLRSTGEVLENPDFIATWTITAGG